MLSEKNTRYGSYVVSGVEKHNGYAGGFFYELAQTVINKDGIVVGAAYAEDFSVRHTEADNMEKLEKIAGVKYTESIIDSDLKEKIERDLQMGKMIFFAGVPCQIISMQQYLKKEYENFYTAAINCPGVICSKVWHDYLEETQAHGSVITEIDFPYRGEFGVSQTKILIKFSHGTAYFRDGKQDKLMMLKNGGLVFKKECYQCFYGKEDLNIDLLLESYYEMGKRDIVQERGLTQVSVFTGKGWELFSSVHSQMIYEKKSKLKKNIFRQHPVKPENYDYFWENYDKYGFTFASDLIVSQMDIALCDRFLQNFLMQYSLLDAGGITLDKILDNWNLEKVILYGHGVISNIFSQKLRYSNRIYEVVKEGFDEKIINVDFPVLITQPCFIPDIMEKLEKKGVDRRRLLSADLLINGEYEREILGGPRHTCWKGRDKGIGTVFLITGAQFENKGAQSMLFVTVSELKRKNSECDIYYLPIDSITNYPDMVISKYQFHIIRKRSGLYSQLYSLLPQLTAIIDISGYALASKWNCSHFIEILLLAKNNHIPIYYMPQSFGPFDFTTDWDRRIKEGLTHAEIIFAREKEGYHLLTQKYGLRNVRMSGDLVLQNKGIDYGDIYLRNLRLDSYKLETDHNVAVIPNIRTYEFGDKNELLENYRYIIKGLLEKGKNVYLLAHSNDEQVCEDIFEMFFQYKNIFIYKKSLDCLEYSILVREFEYIIASRYHSIVHAYKEKTPCIAIGWAAKYKELLDLFGQGRYIFDVRSKIDKKKLMQAVNYMEAAWKQEKEKIGAILSKVQTKNCFDAIL